MEPNEWYEIMWINITNMDGHTSYKRVDKDHPYAIEIPDYEIILWDGIVDAYLRLQTRLNLLQVDSEPVKDILLEQWLKETNND